MKAKRVLIKAITMMVFLASFAYGQIYMSTVDTMSAVGLQCSVGDTICVPIDLANTFSVGSFMMRLTFDEKVFQPLSVKLGDRAQKFNMSASNIEDPGVAVFLGAPSDPFVNYMFPGKGCVAIIKFAVLSDALPGTYNLSFEDCQSQMNSLCNSKGDSLVIPILLDGEIKVERVSIAEDDFSLPKGFELSQNYPNPFNNSTNIAFSLDSPAQVNLEVFDLLGRHVATLFSGWAGTGQTTARWDGQTTDHGQAVSGVYCYRLEVAGVVSETKRMTLLK